MDTKTMPTDEEIWAEVDKLSPEKIRELIFDYLSRIYRRDWDYFNSQDKNELKLARRQYDVVRFALLKISNLNHGAGCSSSAPLFECGCIEDYPSDIAKKALQEVLEMRKGNNDDL